MVGRFINADAFVSTGQGFIGYNMFAYCNNDPVNSIDSSGDYPLDWDTAENSRSGYEFMTWYMNTDENEIHSNGKATLNAKLKQTINAVIDNFEFSAGIGLGLYGTLSALDVVSSEIGVRYDLFQVNYSAGQWEVAQYYFTGLNLEFTPLIVLECDKNEEGYRPLSGTPEWRSPDDERKPSIPICGAGAYFYLGGSISIGYNYLEFFSEIENIYFSGR